jgi:hypothetical protein
MRMRYRMRLLPDCKLHRGNLLALRDDDFMREPNQLLIASCSQHRPRHVYRPLMMRYHLHDEVPVYIAASAGLHVAHHGRHGRGADLEIQSLSLSDIGCFGVGGAGNGSGGRIVGIPKEGNHKPSPSPREIRARRRAFVTSCRARYIRLAHRRAANGRPLDALHHGRSRMPGDHVYLWVRRRFTSANRNI